MRGSRAKLLRRLAEKMTIGKPPIQYTVLKETPHCYDGPIDPVTGEPKKLVAMFKTVGLEDCTRAMYRACKKNLKHAPLDRIKLLTRQEYTSEAEANQKSAN